MVYTDGLRTSRLHRVLSTFSSKLVSSIPSSVGGRLDGEFAASVTLSRHRVPPGRVGDSTLDRGGEFELDFVGVSGAPPGTSSESLEKYGGTEL